MTILDELVAGAREEAARRRRKIPVSRLEERFPDTRRSMAEALRVPGLSVIAEAKKASPSAGVIREDFRPGDVAEAYQEAGAAAMSVLTENRQFLGALEHLAEARSRCTLPLLRKDFIVEEYQLFEARAHGADAVLLIATVLDRPQLTDLLQASRELGLECLVELYEAREMDRVEFDLCRMVGVNNRNLHTFEVDRMHAPTVLAHLPAGIIRVAESGLRTADDLAAVARAGIDAVLIGQAFMEAADPGQALADLIAQTQELLQETDA